MKQKRRKRLVKVRVDSSECIEGSVSSKEMLPRLSKQVACNGNINKTRNTKDNSFDLVESSSVHDVVLEQHHRECT